MTSVRLGGLGIALIGLDALARPWPPIGKDWRHTLVYLFMAYGAIALAASLPPLAVVGAAACTGLFALYSFGRMVGLTQHPPFFLVACAVTLAFYVVGTLHWYGLFQAMPVYAVSLVAAAGTVSGDERAFLQKLCLSWLGLLVFGYLLGHAALFVDRDLHASLAGGTWLALALGLAKAADVAWVATERALPDAPGLRLLVCPIGGAAAGLAVSAALPSAMSPTGLALLGVVVGLGVGAAGRAYEHIVRDVLGDASSRPSKGAMVFTASFAVALAYHFIRYVS